MDGVSYLLMSNLGKIFPIPTLILVCVIAIIVFIKKYFDNPIIFKKQLAKSEENISSQIKEIKENQIDNQKYLSLEEQILLLKKQYADVCEAQQKYVKVIDFEKLDIKVDKLDEKFNKFKDDIKETIDDSNDRQREAQKEDFRELDNKIDNLHQDILDIANKK